MTINIANVIDERKMVEYLQARNQPRDVMTNGVYPNCIKAIEEYDKLVLRLTDENDLYSFAGYHETSTAPVAQYIALLYQKMAEICAIMEAVDVAAIEQTGGPVFGIVSPQVEEVIDELPVEPEV